MQGADQTWRIRIDTATKQRQVLLSRLTQDQLRTVLGTLFDEQALLSPHGLRSLSQRFTSQYTVAEVRERRSATNRPSSARRCMAGTNWRGPVWFLINYLAIRALLQYADFFVDDFTVEYPTRSGNMRTLRAIADELADRLVGPWLPDSTGRPQATQRRKHHLRRPSGGWACSRSMNTSMVTTAPVSARATNGGTALVVDLIIDPPSKRSVVLPH